MESTGTSDSEQFPVIVLVSGERLLMREMLLYEAEKVAEITALKARATEKLKGFSTGIGFWGSPGWVLGGAAALGLVEGLFSAGAQKEGLRLLGDAAAKFEKLSESAVFFRSDRVRGVEKSYPGNWAAVRKIDPQDDRGWLAKRFVDKPGAYEKWYVHNGDDFITIKTDGGVVCIRWSHVASYVPPPHQSAEAARQTGERLDNLESTPLPARVNGGTLSPAVIWPESLQAEFPNESKRHRYRIAHDGSVSAVNVEGERVAFPDWQSFSHFDPTARRY
jgi:hypothetical protein